MVALRRSTLRKMRVAEILGQIFEGGGDREQVSGFCDCFTPPPATPSPAWH
jgi:hypothetical protein